MFRSVVVPFTTSVYSPSKTENSNAVDSESIDIFEKLGDRIYKFGMSFELDEGTILAFNTSVLTSSFVQYTNVILNSCTCEPSKKGKV